MPERYNCPWVLLFQLPPNAEGVVNFLLEEAGAEYLQTLMLVDAGGRKQVQRVY